MFKRKHPYVRRYKFIDKKQQIRFAVDVALHSLLFPILLLLLLILPPYSTILLRKKAVLVKPIILDFFRVCWEHWWVVLLALFCVGYYSILFSHQIMGPMRRFENALLKRKADAHTPVKCNLRKRDYFHNFSKLLEEVLNGSSAEKMASQSDPPAGEEATSKETTS